MKTFFMILGAICFVLIALGGIGVGYIAIRGSSLDKESKAYVDAAIPAIVTNWNKKELLDRASPEFKQAVTDGQIDQLLHWFTSLGRLQKCEPANGQALMSATPQAGKTITAQYVAKAKFEKGEATITVKLIQHGDQWQILGFNVNSPQLVPR